jgi:hypothetical protein
MSEEQESQPRVPFRIAIVDDDDQWSNSVCISLRKYVPPGWEVVSKLPLEDLNDYIAWVEGQRIAAVLIDLKLSDRLPKIRYSGHELVHWLIENLPRLPRFYLTAHDRDQQVKDDFGDVDSTFEKANFKKHNKQSFSRVLRAARNYQSDHYERIGRIAEIARKAALGIATDGEIQEARAISNSREPSAIPAMQTRAKILDDAEGLLAKCNDLLLQIAQRSGNS